MMQPVTAAVKLPTIWIRRAQRLLVALLAAIFLWLSIMNRQDPMLVRTVDNVPIPCPELADTNLTCNAMTETLQVELRAPQSVWDDLALPLYRYLTVTLTPRDGDTALQAGAPHFLCQVKATEAHMEILAYQPKSAPPGSPCGLDIPLQALVAEVDNMTESELTGNVLLPITLERIGEIPADFILQSLVLDERYVDVQGPVAQLNRISRAQVFLPFYSYIFNDKAGDFTMPLPVQILDRDGNALTGLELAPASVTVSLQYVARPNTRRVSVIPSPAVTVPSGYVLEAILSDPEYVTLQGPTELLELVGDPMPVHSEIPVALPVRTTSFTVPLVLPDGITANVEEITFTLEIAHVILDNTQRAVAMCEAEDPDLAYDFTPIFLHLRGPYEAFNQLYAMVAASEFEWVVLYDCPAEEGTFDLVPTRFIFRHEDVEASNGITNIGHDPPLMQLTVKRKTSLDP